MGMFRKCRFCMYEASVPEVIPDFAIIHVEQYRRHIGITAVCFQED